jgi:hypothetical protein
MSMLDLSDCPMIRLAWFESRLNHLWVAPSVRPPNLQTTWRGPGGPWCAYGNPEGWYVSKTAVDSTVQIDSHGC